MRAIRDQKYTLEEYFELERNSEEKWEFWDGTVWSMAGASPVHERVVINAGAHLREILRGRKCSIFSSNLKVIVPAYSPYRYPDLTVYCGEGNFEKMGGMEVLTNPQMIIEILSPSTEAFDRGEKFSFYRSIPSFTEYLLIATNGAYITQLIKKNEDEWVQRVSKGMDGQLHLPAFDVEMLLSEVYLDIDFPEPVANLRLVDR